MMNMNKAWMWLHRNMLLRVLLPSMLALAPHATLAMDAATGASAQYPFDGPGQFVIQQSAFSPMLMQKIWLHGTTHCTVVGSADLRHRSSEKPDVRYEVGLSVDSLDPTFDVRRMVEL